MNRETKLIILSMIIFGTLGLFVRNITVSSGELALARAILAFILISIYYLFTRKKIDKKVLKENGLLLTLSGFAMGIDWILLFQAYQYTSLSIATLAYYFSPILVTIGSTFLFKESMTIKKVICFIMSTIGVFLIIGVGEFTSSKDMMGILFGLAAALFYAIVVLLNKRMKNVSGMERTYIQFFAAIIVLIPYVYQTTGFHYLNQSSISIINLLIVGIIHTGITYCLYFTSISQLPGQKVAILSYIDPLVAVFISFGFLHETLTITQIIGGILILGFAIYNEINIKRLLS